MHIDYPTLSAFADGDLDPASSADVSAHLLACAKCQGEAQFIRELGDGLRALQTPSAPRHAFDRIWPEDREAAPVSELRTHGRKPMQRGWRIALAAGVVGLMAAAFVLTFGADRAMAGASALTLERADGGAMTLRYETISPLAAETSVRARIRYWIPDSLRFAQNEGRFSEIELAREAPGRFEGVADLPPGTVYAVATVEDREGNYLDTDFSRFWEYLETDGRGRPTLDARRYQVLAALELNAGAAAIAQRAAAEFPGQPEFWFWLLSFELAALPADSIDIRLPTHEARLSALDRAARDGNPGPVEIDALSRYARLLERTDLADYWQGELRARYPHHGSAALVRLQEIFLSQASTEEKLDALEADWASVEAPATVQLGLRYSYELADQILTETWLGRHQANSAGRSLSSDTEVAGDLMDVPALWPLAERWIVDRLSDSRNWVGPARRPDQSRYDFEAQTRQNRADLYLYLSRLRLDRGDLEGGIDALERSVEEAWSPRVFVRAAEIHRSLGSEARAAQLISLAQVDPVVPLEPYLSAEDDVAQRKPADPQLTAARATMQERIHAGLLNQYVNLDIGLQSETGEEAVLDQAVGSGRGVTLVLYTMRPDFVPDEDSALLRLNSERLRAAGVRTVFVTQQPDPSLADGLGIDAQFLTDLDYSVWEELGAWRTLQYFVLDRGGRLRHRGEDSETALRISLVLAM